MENRNEKGTQTHHVAAGAESNRRDAARVDAWKADAGFDQLLDEVPSGYSFLFGLSNSLNCNSCVFAICKVRY